MRQEVLEGVGLDEKTRQMMVAMIERNVPVLEGDAEGLSAWFQRCFGTQLKGSVAHAAVGEESNPQTVVAAAL